MLILHYSVVCNKVFLCIKLMCVVELLILLTLGSVCSEDLWWLLAVSVVRIYGGCRQCLW